MRGNVKWWTYKVPPRVKIGLIKRSESALWKVMKHISNSSVLQCIFKLLIYCPKIVFSWFFYLPECKPIRIWSFVSGMCRMINCSSTACNRCKDRSAICSACACPFRIGQPLTTIYASPIVSTCIVKKEIFRLGGSEKREVCTSCLAR